MRFVISTAIFLTLITTFSPGNKFEIGDCLYRDKIQYKVIDIIDNSYVISNYKIIVIEKKAVAETRFIKGTCK